MYPLKIDTVKHSNKDREAKRNDTQQDSEKRANGVAVSVKLKKQAINEEWCGDQHVIFIQKNDSKVYQKFFPHILKQFGRLVVVFIFSVNFLQNFSSSKHQSDKNWIINEP